MNYVKAEDNITTKKVNKKGMIVYGWFIMMTNFMITKNGNYFHIEVEMEEFLSQNLGLDFHSDSIW